MIFVDEQNKEIKDPNWSIYATVRTEEYLTEDGTIDVIMHCRKYTDDELSFRAEQYRKQRISEQTPIAMELFVTQANFSDEDALKVEALYPEWGIGLSYVTGDIRRYNDNLYRALQDSTAAAEHTPDIATSLWKKIGEPDSETGIFPWVQPLGATDAYTKGDKVTHNDKTWISDVDNNTWEPGVYGWSEYVEGGE